MSSRHKTCHSYTSFLIQKTIRDLKYKMVCTSCGWLAAITSCLCFGSFAVPIKSPAAQRCKVDPLVFQTYKTFMCFTTSFLTIPIFDQEFYFTPWGILSALFWVPAGVAAIYAVQHAGLALAQGFWSSLIVLVSFSWGIFVFQEQVKSTFGAILSVMIMVFGIWGMSYYSAVDHDEDDDDDDTYRDFRSESSSMLEDYQMVENAIDDCRQPIIPIHDETLNTRNHQYNRQKRIGLLAAAFNGIWGGSVMAPMKYAPEEAHGTGYVISFAFGAVIITTLLWILRWIYNYSFTHSWSRAYRELPSLHLPVMLLPGCSAGLVWSIGNICSMISVNNLGQGVGYSVTQAAMLVSGRWGIFYYQEVKKPVKKLKWFLAAIVNVIGILCLSYEHEDV
jgi:glucose uptake protein GlcU